MPHAERNSTSFFSSAAVTIQPRFQRPSLACASGVVGFGSSAEWRQVWRRWCAARITQDMRSISVETETAVWIAQLTSWPSPVRARCISAPRTPISACSLAMWPAWKAWGAIGGRS